MPKTFAITCCSCIALSVLCATAYSQESTKKEDTVDREQLFKNFEDTLRDSALVGHFLVDGDQQEQRKKERYEIRSVKKLDQGDYWLFHARIKYGDHDVTVPIPFVEVKWAGTTPVITVDNATIPALGTFDARVVISDGKYAGTWRHGEVGGLMFGHIERNKEEQEPSREQDATKQAE